MAFTKEFSLLLDNVEEPLTKRLKIANNAFNSPDLPLPRKEAFLLTWFLKNADFQQWELLNEWLNSEEFRELNRSNIISEEISTIVKLSKSVIKKLENCDDNLRVSILKSFLLLLENRTFRQYFKHDLQSYCDFLCVILKNINDCGFLIECLKNEHVFSKDIVTDDEFYQHFIDVALPVLVKITHKLNNDLVFQEVSKVIQKYLFARNYKNFEDFVNKFFIKPHSTDLNTHIPKAFFYYLSSIYNLDNNLSKTAYKLVFYSICTSFKEFDVKYKIFIVLNEILGFNLKDQFNLNKISKLNCPETVFSKSIEILHELLDVLTENKNEIDHTVNEISFTDFIKNILKSIIALSKPNATIYQIFLKAVSINPLIIESIIKEVVVYSMLSNNEEIKNDYIDLLKTILEVFSKLHRIQNLISKMVPTIKEALEGNTPNSDTYNFKGEQDLPKEELFSYKIENMLPEKILAVFTDCITNLASWQVMNLVKTLLFHLDVSIKELENDKEETPFLYYIEFLCTLVCWVLSSVRIAEHKVTEGVVEKFVLALDELKAILKRFGVVLLNRKHCHVLVRTFLGVSYCWAENLIVLNYYTTNNKLKLHKSVDSDYSSCNITYLHSYLSVKQWCLLSERITNFGETPCKELLLKLYVQKVKAMCLFENNVNDDVVLNVVKSLSVSIDEHWHDIVSDKFVVKHLLSKMESRFLINLAENVLKNSNTLPENLIESEMVVKAINFTIISKINKAIRQKRKLGDDNFSNCFSSSIYNAVSEDLLSSLNIDEESLDKVRNIYNSFDDSDKYNVKITEEKFVQNIDNFKKHPIIFINSENVQKACVLYLFALHKDVCNSNISDSAKTNLESIIIGILQQCKFNLLEIVDGSKFCKQIINDFIQYETVFQIFVDSSHKNVQNLEGCINCLVENIKNPGYLKCAVLYLNEIPKLKKIKLAAEIKNKINSYKEKVCQKLFKLVTKRSPENDLVEPFVHLLKHLLLDESNNLAEIVELVPQYIEYCLSDCVNHKSCVLFFNTLLNNKNKIALEEETFLMKVWDWSKGINIEDKDFVDYCQMISLIVTLIPNEKFAKILEDLADLINEKSDSLINHLVIWESILSCNFNPVKLKLWQTALESVLLKLLNVLETTFNSKLFNQIVKFLNTIIHTNQLMLTWSMIDLLILTPTYLMKHQNSFFQTYQMSMTLLESLIKYRKPLILDRLPPYLQQYRLLLENLCEMSNSDKNLEADKVEKLSDCAHQLEKLTRNLTACQKDMGRIAMYLIADILQKFEQYTLFVNVKIHLNNCIYSLISLCDQHAVSFLMRVTSSASTEMFKLLYDNYKKYYRFTGKV